MGTTHSNGFACRDDNDKIEKALEYFCGSCRCSTQLDAEELIQRQQKRQQQLYDQGADTHQQSIEMSGVPVGIQKHLNTVHISSESYLGVSSWEPVEEYALGDNILDISTHASEDEFQPRNDNSLPALTPPRCIGLHTSNENVSSPSFLLQKTVSFKSPKIDKRRTESPTIGSEDSSILTGTTTSTECNAVETTYFDTYSYTKTPEANLKDNVRIVFAPRKLFDSQETSNTSRSRNLSQSNLPIDTNQRNEFGNDNFNFSPPLAPRMTSYYTDMTLSKSASADQSIMIRNGVLVRETKVLSPQSSSSSPNTKQKYIPDGVEVKNLLHINTLPSMKKNHPIRLKIRESYAGYETKTTVDENDVNESNTSLLSDAEQAHFFSYDPYFQLGQYLISTFTGEQYGNGLSVKMGERYMTLQDKNGRVWGIMRSRHTWIPSAIIYSPKARYPSQSPSSHRPCGGDIDGFKDSVELFPWALVKKHGRRMDHHVSIHIVAESRMNSELVGGLFEKAPSFKSKHGFDEMENHQHTIVYKINGDEEVPCCMMVRDPVQRDLFDVTIAPGIDPLMIICYMAVHSKMVSSNRYNFYP